MPDTNKVKFGLSKCAYALYDTAAGTYGTPVMVPGAVSISMDPQGENSKFYADNIVYYATYANNGYQGDWELARIPDQMRKDLWGDFTVGTDEVLMEDATAEPAHFALLFQIEGDQKARRCVFYNCTAARPGAGSSTITETKEPQTDTCSLTAAALENGTVKAVTTDDTPLEIFEAWFNQVYVPTVGR